MRNLHEFTNLDITWLDNTGSINETIITNPLPIPLGFSNEDILHIYNLLQTSNKNTFCYGATLHQLEYLFIPLYNNGHSEGMLKIGPFLTIQVNDTFISTSIARFNFPLRYRSILKNFYTSLSILSTQEINNIGYISYNILNEQQPTVQLITYSSELSDTTQLIPEIDSKEKELLEERYHLEKRLMHAIETGSETVLDELYAQHGDKFNIKDRIPGNPLRSAKNIAFVCNTIHRIAAENGGLNPVYINSISEKYAILIEKATTRSQLNKLYREMSKSYVKAVRKYTFDGISPLMRRIVDHIQLNLRDELTPSTLAKLFNLDTSNLSNKFKKETHLTISQFVNQLRVREACYYLKHTELPIKEISHHIGYMDHNYFSRIFRLLKGCSPKAYRTTHTKDVLTSRKNG